MNTNVEKLEKNVVKLEVTVPVEKFKEAVNKSYKKNASRFNIPGFRKGKAPKHIIEKYYGDSVFFEDAINFACDETYPEAIKENDIAAVDYPELDITQIGNDKDFIYTAKVTVKPEVVLGEYKGIETKKAEVKVDDEEIQAHIDSLREKNARIVEKEDGSVENGDIAVIDFEGFIDGVPFEGGKGENYELSIGSGTFIPGFEEQLVGTKANDEVEVSVKFPEDYHAEELKGKEAIFKVKVNGIKSKELPAADDEFAKDVSEFDTLEELKADAVKKHEESKKAKAQKDMEDDIINKIIEKSEMEIPPVMIDREVDYMVKDLDYRLRYQGLTVDKYVELMGITIDAVKNDFRGIAETKVKTNLVLEAIAKKENIKAEESEVEAKAEELASRYGTKDIEKVKKSILSSERAIIEEELVNNKVVELLVQNSKVVE